jgi:uncharacterized protein YkwD
MISLRFTFATLALTATLIGVGCGGSSGKSHEARQATGGAVTSHAVTTTSEGTGGGSIVLDPQPNAAGTYATGTSVQLTATPAAGSLFAGWGGDLNGSTQNPLTVVIQSPLDIRASFDLPAAGTPVADFTINPSPAADIVPFTVNFTDTSANGPTIHRWDFGDGSTSTDVSPSHTYTTPGTYTVTLEVENAMGAGLPSQQVDAVVAVDPSAGSRFWYVNDTYGNPFKTHSAQETALIQQVIVLVNQERAAAGVSPLQADMEAERAAKVHCEDMVGRNYFDHISPEGWAPADRLQMTGATGYTLTGENIAVGQQDAAAVMTAWMNSPGHRMNILDPRFTHIGVGIAGGQPYWAQVFLTR